jgi:hypothetical protein
MFLYEVGYGRYDNFLIMYKAQVDKFGPYFESYLNEINYSDFSVMQIHNIEQMKADKKLRFNVATLQNIGEQLPLKLTPRTISSIQTTIQMLNKELE